MVRAQSRPDYEQPPVSYSASTPHDAITALQQRMAAGEMALRDGDRGGLEEVLRALRVPVESQVLVFSKTSSQRGRITPNHPRALYFSDSVYVGWVPGGLIEVAAIDPQLGPVFYSLDARGAPRTAPKIEREVDCLRCHGGVFVREIPGVFARSVFPNAEGEPQLSHGTQLVDDETPFSDRWGGWYVTGYHGAENHRGNAFFPERGEQLGFTPAETRPDELGEFFETAIYPRPTSDVVALLVLEHQMSMQNSLTHAGQTCRRMMAYQQGLQRSFKEPITDEPAYDSVKSVFASAAQDVLDHLLFRRAEPVPAGVHGHEAFRKRFAEKAPRSRAGAALKDLQLAGRLFALRCSYLIYSDTFRALPDPLRARIFVRLQAALRSRDKEDRYAYLSADEKERIYDVLVETLPEARARWTPRE